jgi:putative ABC transport system ATP-binding protein
VSPTDRETDPTSASVGASCRNLVRTFPAVSGEVHALRGIEASFPRGQITAVVGPSGSGKSSLLRVLSLADRPTAGEVIVDGVAVAAASERVLRRVRQMCIGTVRQRPVHNLYPQLSVVEHLDEAARRRALGGSERRALVDASIDAIALGHRRLARPAALSGGEQQRLSVAAAAIGAPALVLADEPTAELDAASGEAVADLLRLAADAGSAVVVSTHDHRLAVHADRVLAMHHGTLTTESRAATGSLALIDEVGRVQLPPELLEMFGDRRAVVDVVDGAVVLRPSSEGQRR